MSEKNRLYVLMAQLVNTIIALVSGKLIAVYILPGDFGTYNIQFATYTFFSTLMISPFLQFIKSSNNGLLPRIGSKPYLVTLSLLLSITYFGLLIFLYFYYGTANFPLYLLLLLFLPISILNNLVGDYLNVTNRLKEFSWLSVIKATGGLLFIVSFFIMGFSFISDVLALWVMQLCSVMLGTIFVISKYRVFRARFTIAYKTFMKRYWRFAGPLMFLALWTWINNYFDRYAIEYFLSTREVGIYNANYSVGSKIFLMIIPIFMVVLTPKVYELVKFDVKKKKVKKYLGYYFIMSIPVMVIVFYLRDAIGKILLSDNYFEGFELIFWVALAFLFLTMSQLMELVFYSEGRTKLILYGNIYSALINILLNVLFIPTYGIFGAAIATCLGFFSYFILLYINLNRIKYIITIK